MKKSGNKLIVVLGMHRSGTSVVTRGLQVMGVDLGNKLMPPVDENNEKGFWEDMDIYSLNMEMLNSLNSDWHFLTPIQPSDVNALRRDGYLLRAVEMLREKTSDAPLFGFKDPRVARLLPFWKEVFAQTRLDVSYVLTIRHPLSVCKSLEKRDGFDFEKGCLLWLEHVISSLVGTAGENRILVDYDRLMQSPEAELTRMAKKFQLQIDMPKLEDFKTGFLDEELRHTVYQLNDLTSDEAAPPLAREVYSDILKAATIDGRLDASSFRNKIAQWSDEFSRQKSALALVDKLTSKIFSMDQALAEKEQAIQARSSQIANLTQVVAARDGLIAILQRDLNFLSATLTEIYSSRVWRISAPLRWYGRQRQNAAQLIRALPILLSRPGGVSALFRDAISAWRQDGWAAVKLFARQYLDKIEETNSSPSAESTELDMVHKPSQRPEILFVSHEASRTGAPIFLLDLMRFLSGCLDLDFVILLRSGGELERDFRKLGATVVLSDPYKLDSLVLHALKKRDIKLVYSNTITNGAVQKRLKQLGCPILCHVHELAFSIDAFYGDENLKQVLDTTTKFLAGSEAVAGNLREQLRLPEERIVVAHPFISIQANLNAMEKMPLPLNLPQDVVVVGACGTIGWRKGTDLFLQVARLVLAKTNQPVVFVWVGGPLSRGDHINLRYDAKLMGIEKHVIFTGGAASHLPYFAQFDIFVLPSREDPFPLVALDAASMGIPIVCFDRAGGAPELVEEDAGVVVPYLDIDRMAEAVRQLVEDDVLRRRLGERAQAKVLERHDTSVGGERIAKIIKTFLS